MSYGSKESTYAAVCGDSAASDASTERARSACGSGDASTCGFDGAVTPADATRIRDSGSVANPNKAIAQATAARARPARTSGPSPCDGAGVEGAGDAKASDCTTTSSPAARSAPAAARTSAAMSETDGEATRDASKKTATAMRTGASAAVIRRSVSVSYA